MSYAKEANRVLENYRRQSQIDLENREKEVFEKIEGFQDAFIRKNKLGYEYIKANIKSEENKARELEKEIQDVEDKLTKMLLLNGYPKDYLKLKHHCDKCQDTGVYNNTICSCKRTIMVNIAREKSSLNEQMKSENFENFDIDVFDDTVNPGFPISQKDYMANLANYLKTYSQNYKKGDKSLILYGPVGVGKTYLLSSMAKEIIDRGYSLIYLSALQLIKRLFDIRYKNFNEQPKTEIEDLLYDCDVLMIDDLGTENSTDNNISLLFDLLNDRIQRKKTTIISTNIDIEDLSSQYDARISSRIKGEFEPIRFFGRDIREKRFNDDYGIRNS